ncbi:MAG: CcmD family protein [Armatimonadota bacterium]|nr:CcmD family protein [Armatimonadota bacterium]MDR5702837.1 CcmD family protein [Armatimonadota bacterium]
MKNLTLLFFAYLMIWIGLFAYLLFLIQRGLALSREIAALKQALAAGNRDDPERRKDRGKTP